MIAIDNLHAKVVQHNAAATFILVAVHSEAEQALPIVTPKDGFEL